MAGARQMGYTIVEVTLFLAISGVMLSVALIGTSGTIHSLRFSDSGKSLLAYMQKQYDDIINGVNQRDATSSCAGGVVSTASGEKVGTSNCLLMGKLLVFQPNSSKISTYVVVGTEPAGANYNLSDDQLITAFRPHAVTQINVETYDIPWQAYLSGSKRLNLPTPPSPVAANAVLLIRSPKSSRVVSYTFKTPASFNPDLTTVVSDAQARSQTTNLCIISADGIGAPAKLVVGIGTNQSAVDIVFDTNGSECNGV